LPMTRRNDTMRLESWISGRHSNLRLIVDVWTHISSKTVLAGA
jgi:hypothetical protein